MPPIMLPTLRSATKIPAEARDPRWTAVREPDLKRSDDHPSEDGRAE